MKISVIICTRNRFEDLTKTLPSLVSQTRLPDEIIIVDSSDNEQSKKYITSIHLPFSVRYFHTRAGLTLQRNYGIQESIGDLIFFFDDDVDLDVNYLSAVEKVFVNDRLNKIGAVGGRIVASENKNLFSVRVKLEKVIFATIRFIFGLVGNRNGKFYWSGMPSHPHATIKNGFIECLSGCCMAFRREVFNKIQFDENLTGYGLMEDVDISKQTLDAGYKIYYQTSATLIHNESPMNRLKVQQWAEMSVINYDYLFRKNWSKDTWRYFFYYWAMLGLIAVNFHSMKGLQGTFSGLKKVFSK